MPKHTSCLICSSGNIKKLSDFYERHKLVKCHSCGFVFMENIPTEEELNTHYSKYAYSSNETLSPMTVQSYQLLLDEFEKYRKHNKILDVGCGRGWFLQEAAKRGWEVYGTEYSETAIKICESKGLNMKAGQLNRGTFPRENFDVITSFEVIEHINNPHEEMTHIHSFLRQGGLFYCTTPNFNAYLRFYLKDKYDIIEYPEHLSYYTRSTLKKLMKEHGFIAKKILTTGISITRLKTSQKDNKEELISEESDDEKLREQIQSKWYLGYIKSIANTLLTILGSE